MSFRKIYEGRNEETLGISKKTTILIERLLKKTFEGEFRWRKLIEKLEEKFENFFQESFCLLDKTNKGFIVIDDLRVFFNTWELFPTIQETEMIFSRFDLFNEGIISMKDFMKNLGNWHE